MDLSFELFSNSLEGLNAVLTIDDKAGSERLDNWLDVTELLTGRVGIPPEGFGLVPVLFCAQNCGP